MDARNFVATHEGRTIAITEDRIQTFNWDDLRCEMGRDRRRREDWENPHPHIRPLCKPLDWNKLMRELNPYGVTCPKEFHDLLTAEGVA